MIQKPADTEQPIANIIAERWSGRAYDSSTEVTEEQIISLCEAARWAPSCFGDAPWRFIVCNKFTNESAWQKALDCLMPGNQAWAKNAPLLIFATSVANFSHNDTLNAWASYDTGAASLSLCLQATSMGLISHQMGGFDAEKTYKTFNIPQEVNIWSVIAVGVPSLPDDLSPEQLEQELKERERQPLKHHFYSNQWGD